MTLILATTRETVASYLQALITVYSILIFVYILLSMVFSLGGKIPYARWSDMVLTFLRDVCEPYLRIFRRLIPMIGPLDISPIFALLALQIVGGLIISLVAG